MFAEDNEIFDPQKILTVLYVLLLDLHQDIDLVERQLHVLTTCPYDLYCYCFSSLVVECLYYFSEGSSSKSLEKLIAVSNLLMLLPNVPPFKIVLPHSRPYPHIVHSLLVDQFDPLIL